MPLLNAPMLPETMLTLIMSYIHLLSQLKECRLVCKAWTNPGLINMLGQEIVLRSDSGTLRLYDILLREPSRAHLIKHLKIEAEISDSFILKQLLRLALTPNIETIRGDHIHDEFFIEFNMIVATWPQGFRKLRALPNPNMITAAYFTAVWYVRNSLKRLLINIDGSQRDAYFYICIAMFSQFKNLASLSLIMDGMTDLRTLEMVVLRTCPSIVELTWHFGVIASDVVQPPDIKNWIKLSVEKQEYLEILQIQDHCPTHYLQYFLHKYPNTKKINISSTVSCNGQTMTDLKRIIGLIENGPSKKIVVFVDPRQDFRAIMKCLLLEYSKYKIDPRYNKVHDRMELALYTDE
ncbi:hypothetical protein V8B55DRAFT_1560343 [Mucor lusitanicus]|uniref:F-box domain-containing protein n=1 Tax=Mucor circinelloides f. lusitanicus TaxID=29924 RepID=A0A8H4BGF6_MUCCL|nr:hypothetical protein FB192DRAFT_1446451 [Mucor lusitanicus]